jgi:hypothetical protein
VLLITDHAQRVLWRLQRPAGGPGQMLRIGSMREIGALWSTDVRVRLAGAFAVGILLARLVNRVGG